MAFFYRHALHSMKNCIKYSLFFILFRSKKEKSNEQKKNRRKINVKIKKIVTNLCVYYKYDSIMVLSSFSVDTHFQWNTAASSSYQCCNVVLGLRNRITGYSFPFGGRLHRRRRCVNVFGCLCCVLFSLLLFTFQWVLIVRAGKAQPHTIYKQIEKRWIAVAFTSFDPHTNQTS